MTHSFPPRSLVLYADDDPDDIELVEESFSRYSEHIQLSCFFDGSELLQYIRQMETFDPMPCLIILDINMPKIDGKETLLQLKKMSSFCEIPIVLFTTSSMPSDVEFAIRHGAGCITKPLDHRQMSLIIDQFIDHCTEEVRKKIKNM
jgi:CheY-like chemotaxis protein